MQKILYPEREKWTRILERPENKGEDLDKVCKAVFDEVRRDGDEALRKYTWYFDRVRIESLCWISGCVKIVTFSFIVISPLFYVSCFIL